MAAEELFCSLMRSTERRDLRLKGVALASLSMQSRVRSISMLSMALLPSRNRQGISFLSLSSSLWQLISFKPATKWRAFFLVLLREILINKQSEQRQNN